MYTTVYHVLLLGKFLKFTIIRKWISYKKISLTQCIYNKWRVWEIMIRYNRIPALSRSIILYEGIFNKIIFQAINPKMISMKIVQNIGE